MQLLPKAQPTADFCAMGPHRRKSYEIEGDVHLLNFFNPVSMPNSVSSADGWYFCLLANSSDIIYGFLDDHSSQIARRVN
ncbi:hypothetical protein RvY_11901 [Ramazzottius varieornatus]|uniref:Uncharacterized protein n=1 Tax=Ramazzottius varieornatus TaxID=947166 RepID=A0A1D1VK23_RAMVA|nr:hypothetical protein RvY_11901 [Ramazzottius varieornatus]